MEDGFDAVAAEGAFEGADHGIVRGGRKVFVATFAVGAELEHVFERESVNERRLRRYTERMNKRSGMLTAAALLLLAAGVWGAHRLAFDWRSLGQQLKSVAWVHVGAGVACIYAGTALRAVRWRVLLGPDSTVSVGRLVAPQFIGFSAVALFGRLVDLSRPYLIARRAGLPVATQIAVYSIERIFDLAAAAILFSVTLALAPHDLPHHEAFVKAGLISLAATVGLAVVALTIRFAGDLLARVTAAMLRPLLPKFADAAAERILDFRKGLDTLRSTKEFVGRWCCRWRSGWGLRSVMCSRGMR